MFKTSSTEECGHREISGNNILQCNTGMIYCESCFGTIYCNDCVTIDITGEVNVEIFAHNVRSISCKGGCRAIINVFYVGDVSCLSNCNMVLNAVEAVSVTCYRDCNATVRVSTGTDISCSVTKCHMTTIFHNNFTQFCLNSGFGYPHKTTESSITTTTLSTTTVKSQETTTVILTTELTRTGKTFPLLCLQIHKAMCSMLNPMYQLNLFRDND